MADIELLPLPELPRQVEGYSSDYWEAGQIEEYAADYARANVEHHTAKLRAEVSEWKRVAAAQAELHVEAEARAERLAEALRRYGNHIGCCPDSCACGLNEVLRDAKGRYGNIKGMKPPAISKGCVMVPVQTLESIRDSSTDPNARGFAEGALAARPQGVK